MVMEIQEIGAKLAAALVAFQAEVTNPEKTATNPFHKSKYAPLDVVLNHVRDVLAKHGLAAVQMTSSRDGRIGVTTRIIHTSGEYMDCAELLLSPSSNGPQGEASAITYARRYSLQAALGIFGESDDDGNAASKASNKVVSAAAEVFPFVVEMLATVLHPDEAERTAYLDGCFKAIRKKHNITATKPDDLKYGKGLDVIADWAKGLVEKARKEQKSNA